jgi:SAM-dependent methyltransferase
MLEKGEFYPKDNRPDYPERLERKRRSFIEESQDKPWNFDDYVYRLGLPLEELKGKRVLDIGASESAAKFGRGAREHEIDAVELKTSIDSKSNEKEVVGLGQNLPFKDESFDAVVALWSVPAYLPEFRSEWQQMFQESLRVLKPGGKAYYYPVHWGARTEDLETILKGLKGLKERTLTSNIETDELFGQHVRPDHLVIEKEGGEVNSGENLSE